MILVIHLIYSCVILRGSQHSSLVQFYRIAFNDVYVLLAIYIYYINRSSQLISKKKSFTVFNHSASLLNGCERYCCQERLISSFITFRKVTIIVSEAHLHDVPCAAASYPEVLIKHWMASDYKSFDSFSFLPVSAISQFHT